MELCSVYIAVQDRGLQNTACLLAHLTATAAMQLVSLSETTVPYDSVLMIRQRGDADQILGQYVKAQGTISLNT